MALAHPFYPPTMSHPRLVPPTPATQQAPPLQPSDLDLSKNYNMSGGSLTEALLTLSALYIGLVQPEGPVPVGLHAFFPDAKGDFVKQVTGPFSSPGRTRLALQNYQNIRPEFKIATDYSSHDYTPKELLDTLCKQVFPLNTISFLYLNNPQGLQYYPTETVKYLPRLMESLGVPIISYDTQFSLNTRPALSVQLAPTMGQMMDVFFAFLKRFKWHDFSFLCTMSFGCQEEVTVIRQKVEESHKKPNLSVYGVDMYSFNLLSFVNFTNGQDAEEVTEKLTYELHQDTRIFLLHGDGGEVKDIMDVAKRVGLTGREYVWIYTGASLKHTAGISRSFPLGSFVIGYDSDKDDMVQVVKDGVHIFLQALNSLAASPEMKDIDFQTGFSCNREIDEQQAKSSGDSFYPPGPGLGRPPLKWKYGSVLYKHILKTKLSGEFGFDERGVLKANKFWIKNIQPDVPSSGSSRSSSSRPSGSSKTPRFGSRKPSSRGSSYGGRSSSAGGPTFGGRDSGSSRRRQDTRGGDIFSRNRDSGGSRTRPSSSDYRSRYPQDRPRDDRPWWKTKPSKGPSNIVSPKDQGPPYATAGGIANRQRRDTFVDTSDLESYSLEETVHEEALHGERRRKRSLPHLSFRSRLRLRTRRSMLRRGKRASPRQVAKKIATWNGRNLTVTGITWPGGASKPPTGKPAKYTLRVVTWKEDPQVKYTELIERTDPNESPCDANSLPCKIYERNSTNHRLSNETKDACCTGLCIDLLKKLGNMLHFDVILTEVDEGAYGSPLNDNRTQWNGMLGKLVHGHADMAMGALSITPQRSEVVDFSVPFLQTGITIIVAIRAGAISTTAFLEPYDYPSWSLILVFSVHATGASIFIFEWLSPYGLDQGKTPLSVHKFSLFRSFWLIWAMLFGASVSTDQPRGCASRFLANIWALFAVVFCASYTANLAAFMITKDDFYDLSGIQDWRLKNPNHRKPPFQFATIEKSATDLNIAENYKEIHNFMKQNPQTDVKTAIRRLKENKIQAFIYDSTTLEYEVGKDVDCKLKTVGKRISETGYGIAFPKKSQWTEQINRALLWLREDGEIERLQKFWLAGACHKKKETGVSSHTLGILNFTSAFVLLGVGVGLGIILLIMEHCYFRFGRKSLKKWDKCGCCSLVSLSMGQSLTFEQSVMEAIDFHRHHKCKDPLCETQLWKVKHELDLALLKVGQLRKQLAHSSALEASSEDMRALDKTDETSSPYQNGSAARRRRRQTAGDETGVKGQGYSPDTRQPLLALEGARSETESDDDPSSSSPRRHVMRTPTSAEVEFAPSIRSGKKGGSLKGNGQKTSLVPGSGDPAKPSRYGAQSGAESISPSSTTPGSRNSRQLDGEDDQFASYPPPPPFEEVLASEDYSYPRHPPTGPSGVADSSALRSPSLTPPPPPHVPPPSADPFSQGSSDRQLPAESNSSGQGSGGFPPPPPLSSSSQSPETPEQPGSSLYSLAHKQPAIRTPTTANNDPKSSVQVNKSNEMPLTSSIEDDNDRSLRRQRSNDGNMYVNVDNIVGKETYF